MNKCPNCREEIEDSVMECKHCGVNLTNYYKARDIIKDSNKEVPVRWLKFYTYVRIPLGIALGIAHGLFLSFLIGEPMINIVSTFVCCIFYGLLFYGLRKRLFWSWRLNWILLSLETFLLGPLDFASRVFYSDEEIYFSIGSFIGATISLFFVWFLPNYLYFKKRRHLFVKGQGSKHYLILSSKVKKNPQLLAIWGTVIAIVITCLYPPKSFFTSEGIKCPHYLRWEFLGNKSPRYSVDFGILFLEIFIISLIGGTLIYTLRERKKDKID